MNASAATSSTDRYCGAYRAVATVIAVGVFTAVVAGVILWRVIPGR